MGLGASSWIRPTKIHERMWIDFVLPILIAGGLYSIVGGMKKEEIKEEPIDYHSLECCSIAYQAFVKKVGVSYAIFEAEKYCQAECTAVIGCLDDCAQIRKKCRIQDKSCKDFYRTCVFGCPPPLKSTLIRK